MKKAQAMEFIGIIMLLVVVAVFALFSRVTSSSQFVEQSEEALSQYQQYRFALISKVFPYITMGNIPVEQLLGVYMCYGNKTTDYGMGKIDIISNITWVMDTALDQEWQIQVGNKCLKAGTILEESCKLPSAELMSQSFVFKLPCNNSFARAVIMATK
ncbi:MAG: hypothetical protein ABIG95_01200 [Candidatus Woesearchaeota archaeon]